MYIGVDIGKRRWVAAAVSDVVLWVNEFTTFDELLEASADAATIAVDLPVRLEAGWRRCDAEARALLGRRASTLFAVPPRAALEAATYADARRIATELTGASVSAQAYNLRNWIAEVEPRADRDQRIHEAHPELSFAVMAGEPIAEPKMTWNGQMRRRHLLVVEGLEIDDLLVGVEKSAADDVLDAVAVAWSARRIARGEAERIPATGGDAAIWR